MSRQYRARQFFSAFTMIIVMLIQVESSNANPGPPESCSDLKPFQWLQGHWASDDDWVRHETWQSISEDTMEGKGWSQTPNGESRDQESLRLMMMQDAVFYLAKVAHNRLPIAFKATRCQPDLAVFENPAHDFPQRLTYRLHDRRLHVEISDLEGTQSFNLVFTRR